MAFAIGDLARRSEQPRVIGIPYRRQLTIRRPHCNVQPPRPVRSVECAPEGGDGDMGAYFADPSGHSLEIITRPYGSGSATRG
jgi:hypothetical protein